MGCTPNRLKCTPSSSEHSFLLICLNEEQTVLHIPGAPDIHKLINSFQNEFTVILRAAPRLGGQLGNIQKRSSLYQD